MNEDVINTFCEVWKWDWSSIIQSVAALATVCIAYAALNSWKKQNKSQKITGLLDELTDAIHELVLSIGPAIQRLKFIRIAIESQTFNRNLNPEYEHPETICFIEGEGRESATELMAALAPCEDSVHKIRSLVVKGQIYDIDNYVTCQNTCAAITHQFDRLQAAYIVLSSTNMNWEHPMVAESIRNFQEITPESIETSLSDNQVEFIRFVKSSYKKEYKNA